MSFSQQFRVPERIGGKWKITMYASCLCLDFRVPFTGLADLISCKKKSATAYAFHESLFCRRRPNR